MSHPLLSLPLYRVPFAVIDVETTGLHPGLGDSICEIAVLQVRDREVLGEYQSLVNPGQPIPPDVYAIHHIGDELLRSAPTFAEVAEEVVERLEGTAVVAHNAPFDLSFLVAALEELRLPIPDNPVVDTLALARQCYGFPRNNLHAVARDLGIHPRHEHRALADVGTTWQVLSFFSQDLQARWGISTLGELIRAQGGPIPWPKPLPLEVLSPVLVEALERQRFVRLRYRSVSGEVSERTVEPLRVGMYRGSHYLVARCTLRGERRTFRLDRVLEMHLQEIA